LDVVKVVVRVVIVLVNSETSNSVITVNRVGEKIVTASAVVVDSHLVIVVRVELVMRDVMLVVRVVDVVLLVVVVMVVAKKKVKL